MSTLQYTAVLCCQTHPFNVWQTRSPRTQNANSTLPLKHGVCVGNLPDGQKLHLLISTVRKKKSHKLADVKLYSSLSCSLTRLRGLNLFEHVTVMDHFSEGNAAYFMEQLLSAVTYLHKLNIVHLAIKVYTYKETCSSRL